MTTVNNVTDVTERVCAFCNAPLPHDSKKEFCSNRCRTANNRAKWGMAPHVLYYAIRGRGVVPPHPSLIGKALRHAGTERSNKLMETFGYEWNRALRQWQNVARD